MYDISCIYIYVYISRYNIDNQPRGDTAQLGRSIKLLGTALAQSDLGKTCENLVPTIYKAFFLGLCKEISPQDMAQNMVQYLKTQIATNVPPF